MSWRESKRIVTTLQRSVKVSGESKSESQSLAVGLMLGIAFNLLLWWIVF